MFKDLRTQINWLERNRIKEILESHGGFAVYDNEDMEDLKDILQSAIEDGDISEDTLHT